MPMHCGGRSVTQRGCYVAGYRGPSASPCCRRSSGARWSERHSCQQRHTEAVRQGGRSVSDAHERPRGEQPVTAGARLEDEPPDDLMRHVTSQHHRLMKYGRTLPLVFWVTMSAATIFDAKQPSWSWARSARRRRRLHRAGQQHARVDRRRDAHRLRRMDRRAPAPEPPRRQRRNGPSGWTPPGPHDGDLDRSSGSSAWRPWSGCSATLVRVPAGLEQATRS